MTLALTILSMIVAWMVVAITMLWGLVRIARRHQGDRQQVMERP
jgi:hypothetical protein